MKRFVGKPADASGAAGRRQVPKPVAKAERRDFSTLVDLYGEPMIANPIDLDRPP